MLFGNLLRKDGSSDTLILSSSACPTTDSTFSVSQLFRVEVLFNGRKHFVLRRYSEFQMLHRKLKKILQLPEFPSKRTQLRSKPHEQRRQELEEYLQVELKVTHPPVLQYVLYVYAAWEWRSCNLLCTDDPVWEWSGSSGSSGFSGRETFLHQIEISREDLRYSVRTAPPVGWVITLGGASWHIYRNIWDIAKLNAFLIQEIFKNVSFHIMHAVYIIHSLSKTRVWCHIHNTDKSPWMFDTRKRACTPSGGNEHVCRSTPRP